jgi:hypothetical protein
MAEKIPNAITEHSDDPERPRDLFLGDPCCHGANLEVLAEDPASGIPGTYATVKCNCGQLFRIDLVNDELKLCPNCETAFTHYLVIGPDNDPDLGYAVIRDIFDVNDPEDDPDAEADETDNPDADPESGKNEPSPAAT